MGAGETFDSASSVQASSQLYLLPLQLRLDTCFEASKAEKKLFTTLAGSMGSSLVGTASCFQAPSPERQSRLFTLAKGYSTDNTRIIALGASHNRGIAVCSPVPDSAELAWSLQLDVRDVCCLSSIMWEQEIILDVCMK